MKIAKAHDTASAAQLVADECVVLAETKDHQNWELIGHLGEYGQGEEADALKILHSGEKGRRPSLLSHQGFYSGIMHRIAWLTGGPANPEDVKKVGSAICAARADNQRDEMLKAKH